MTHRSGVIAALLVVLAAGLAYLPALDNPLHFDDQYVLRDNPLTSGRQALGKVLGQKNLTEAPVYGRHYRPVALLSFWLTARVFGPSVAVHRFINVLIHLACALLVGLLGRRLVLGTGRGEEQAYRVGLIAGALFALHPLYSVTINQVYKRTSSLADLLILLAVLCLVRALRGEAPRYRSWAAAVVLGAVAQLTKEHAAVLPVLAGLYGYSAGLWQGRARTWIVALASIAAPQLAVLALTFPSDIVDRGWLSYLMVQPRVIFEYVLALFFPSRVVLLSGLDRAPFPPTWDQVLGLAALVGLFASALALRKRTPLLSFAVIWAAVCLAPTSSVLPNPIVGDLGRAYLASFGLVTLAAVALERSGRVCSSRASSSARPIFFALPAAVVCVLCVLGTMAVNQRHSSSIGVWTHEVSLYPHHPLINDNLCAALAEESDPRTALAQCQKASRLDPSNTYIVPGLVQSLARLGRSAEAEQVIRRAVARSGYTWVLALTHGHLLWYQERWDEAARAYKQVLRSSPSNTAARLYLADTWRRLGKPERIAPLLSGVDEAALDPGQRALFRELRSAASAR